MQTLEVCPRAGHITESLIMWIPSDEFFGFQVVVPSSELRGPCLTI